MKKTIIMLLITCSAFQAKAQNSYIQKGDFIGSGGLSGHYSSHAAFGIGIHPDVQFMFAKHFSAGVNTWFNYQQYYDQNKIWGLYYSASIEGRYWFNNKESRFTPYLYANFGKGAEYLKYGTVPQNIPHPYSGNAGIGAMYWITPKIAVEARIDLVHYSVASGASGIGTSAGHPMQLGITYRFNRKNSAPPENR